MFVFALFGTSVLISFIALFYAVQLLSATKLQQPIPGTNARLFQFFYYPVSLRCSAEISIK
jgi:hypothetical protein